MKKVIYAFIISFVCVIVLEGYAKKTHNELSNSVVRLHIVANSDSKIDQDLKLCVRDNLIKNVSVSSDDFLAECEQIANKTLKTIGYKATAEYGNYYFPTKKYKNIILPCGKYNAVRIMLGEGKGKNWWCILYPPMCVENRNITMDNYSLGQLKHTLSEDSFEVITKNNMTVKFKTVEIVNELLNLIDNL